jgi:dTDP-4-dehydrorhamnose reductase
VSKVKALIFGRTGQVGWELQHKLTCLGPIAVVGTPEVDFTRPDTIRDAVRRVDPAVIVNAAAYTAVDKAESEPELAMAINGTAPGVLAEEAKRLGCLLVHYSTDYVYDGTKHGAYVETDATSPLNVYGKTKLAGDEAIASIGCEHLIFRTTWVYGARGANFLLTILRLSKEREELRIVDDQTGAPTSSDSIAQATTDVLSRVFAPAEGGLQGRSGVYNMTCAGATTWFGFAKAVLEKSAGSLGEGKPRLIPIPTIEFPRPAVRPANSRLSGDRLEEAFGVRIPDWEDALAGVLSKLRDGTART